MFICYSCGRLLIRLFVKTYNGSQFDLDISRKLSQNILNPSSLEVCWKHSDIYHDQNTFSNLLYSFLPMYIYLFTGISDLLCDLTFEYGWYTFGLNIWLTYKMTFLAHLHSEGELLLSPFVRRPSVRPSLR